MPLQPQIRALIEQMQSETDTKKLLDLAAELNRLLDEEVKLTRAAQTLRPAPFNKDR